MNVAVVGAQWGDEGKGKIIDYLAEKADVIARFNGGNELLRHCFRLAARLYVCAISRVARIS